MRSKTSRRKRRNPSRRRARSSSKSRSRSRRRNPSMGRSRRRTASRSRRSSGSKRRRNPAFTLVRSHARRVKSRRRRNPSFVGTLKSGLNVDFVSNALLTAGGLILGTKTATLMNRLPFMSDFGRFSGAVNLLGGGILAAHFKHPKLKSLFLGIAAGGAYNLVASNLPQLGISNMSGDDLLGVDVGGESLAYMHGVDVGGESPVVVLGDNDGGNWGSNW
jgi:hypothetical protein